MKYYRHIKEPLNSPDNTIQALLHEITFQGGQADQGAERIGYQAVGFYLNAKSAIEAEVIRRFGELEQRAQKAEQQLRDQAFIATRPSEELKFKHP